MSHQRHSESVNSQQHRTSSSPDNKKSVGSRLYLQVADSLAQFIMSNSLSEGDRLPSERELAQVYEVSRQTIREALIALEVRHLVNIKSGSGVYVATNADNVPPLIMSEHPSYLDTLEALARFAGEAIFLATQRASNEELLIYNAHLNKIKALTEQKNFTDIAEQVSQMHQLIATASGNSIVEHITKWLWQLHDVAILRLLQQRTEASQGQPFISNPFSDDIFCQTCIACYQNLYELMSQRDADAARNKIQAHLRYLSEYFSSN